MRVKSLRYRYRRRSKAHVHVIIVILAIALGVAITQGVDAGIEAIQTSPHVQGRF